jgi:hypothetical protein
VRGARGGGGGGGGGAPLSLFDAAALPPPWTAHLHPSSGAVYYHNAETGSSSWLHPRDAPLPIAERAGCAPCAPCAGGPAGEGDESVVPSDGPASAQESASLPDGPAAEASRAARGRRVARDAVSLRGAAAAERAARERAAFLRFAVGDARGSGGSSSDGGSSGGAGGGGAAGEERGVRLRAWVGFSGPWHRGTKEPSAAVSLPSHHAPLRHAAPRHP